MHLHSLFPTPIGFFKLDRKLTKSEQTFIMKQEVCQNVSNRTSKNNFLLNEKELKGLRSFIEGCVNEYFTEIYKPLNNVKPYMTQSWANYTQQNEAHHPHKHSNSFCSGVFYVKADKNLDRISFLRDQREILDIPSKEWNAFNSKTWWYDVGEGELIMFPSTLIHLVEPVTTDRTRISISFNTFVKGELGVMDSLNGLVLD